MVCAFSVLPAVAAEPPKTTSPTTTKDKRLGERLIRKATSDADEDLMAGIILMMDEATRKLEIDFDAGEDTLTLQREIVDKINEAVKVAAAGRRKVRSRPRTHGGDKRRKPKGNQSARKSTPRSSGDARSAASPGENAARGGATQAGAAHGQIREVRRTWGRLPLREREEIIQGVGERFIERYRVWIERYYRALQETED